MKRVVYTAVFGGYDNVEPISFKSECDFYVFTDNGNCNIDGWKTVLIEKVDDLNLSKADLNRYLKINIPDVIKKYDQSLYIDGHVRINCDPTFLFDKYLSNHDIAIPPHHLRTCVFDEAAYCIKTGITNNTEVSLQIERYKAVGFPQNFGLTENGIIFRSNSSSKIKLLMDEWWSEYINGVKRDQLSLPFVLWRLNIVVGLIEEGPRYLSSYFTLQPHAIKKMGKVKSVIWHIQTHQNRSHLYKLASKLIGWLQAYAAK